MPAQQDQPKTYATALVGFGKIAQGYSQDKVMAKVMEYASHAQVLASHPRLNWCTVIDPDAKARELAKSAWAIADTQASIDKTAHRDEIELAVLATPPGGRLDEIKAFPNLKAVLIEKPLAENLQSSKELIEYCKSRSILVQVNLLRRADIMTRSLRDGYLVELIGELQAGMCLYGNGLKNNGLHMIDLVRMLFGEIHSVQALSQNTVEESPMPSDCGISFALTLANRKQSTITFNPVSFKNWRENGLILFGNDGRFDYLHGGLSLLHYKRAESRMGGGEMEIGHDHPEKLTATMGSALYEIYDNLLNALSGDEKLCSTGDSALASTAIVDAVFASFHEGGKQKVLENRAVNADG